jgi:hypothetical protein
MKAGLIFFACLFSCWGRAWSQSGISLLASENMAHQKFDYLAIPGNIHEFDMANDQISDESQNPNALNNIDFKHEEVPVVSAKQKPEISLGWNQTATVYFEVAQSWKNMQLLETYIQNKNLQYPAYKAVESDFPLTMQVLQTGTINSLTVTQGADQNTVNILVPVFMQGYVELSDADGTQIQRLSFRGSETSMALNFRPPNST